jgi:hypothetical protein
MRPLSEKEGKTAIDAWTAFMEDLKKTQEKKPEPPPDVPMSKFLEVFLKEFGVSAQYQPGGQGLAAGRGAAAGCKDAMITAAAAAVRTGALWVHCARCLFYEQCRRARAAVLDDVAMLAGTVIAFAIC